MSLWSRFSNVFRGERLNREIDEELEAHIADAIDAGRDAGEARRALGSAVNEREQSRDVRLLPWLDSLRADVVFGYRQLRKHKVVSAAAILSLALAIGSCTAAFRLIDALLLRPLPVKDPDRLYLLDRQREGPDGKPIAYDAFAYPAFAQMRTAVRDQAELMAVSYEERVDLTYKSDHETEKANLQYVSGQMFGSLGLRPALGRLLTPNDDRTPGGHPVAVLSRDYWMRRFGGDASVIGRTFRLGSSAPYEIAGVLQGPFTGTETGTVTDIFVPTMMHPGAIADDWTWIRILARLKPGVAAEPVRARLHAASRAFEEERAKGFKGMSRQDIDKFLAQTLVLEPAGAGASALQADYRESLAVLGVLVALVLLIACANVANLMSAQAAARAREMALRVSIGAGRWRLVQLVLVEGAWIAALAAFIGWAFAWWAAPFVVGRINPPDNPARLSLPVDWRVLGFGLALTAAVTCLFGLAPALRASSVKPAAALKGGDDPHARRRTMHALIAVQVAFCSVVLFVAGLFVATLDRLSHRPLGFSAERVITLDTIAQRAEPPVFWDQVVDHIRSLPGVEKAALSGWPLLGGGAWNGFISVNGAPPGPELGYFLSISPGWIDTMKIPLMAGRDFLPEDTFPGAAIVNETFAKEFFRGESPIGKRFAKGENRCVVIGMVRDSPYRNIREPTLPVAYVPFHGLATPNTPRPVSNATIVVRASGSSAPALASALRLEVPRARAEFRVSNIRTQVELVQAQTVRERLLAMLALFFAIVAVLLAGVGLYGVLDYSVLQRRREIGIRMAIGAQAGEVAWRVTSDVVWMLCAGAFAGLGLGLASGRYIESLLYQVKATDASALIVPLLVMFGVASVSAVPAVIRAVRIDPAAILRSE
ncbi:MAG: ABC transporter permease [Bryobacteraceae bacterium]